jgi:hypothetical protein
MDNEEAILDKVVTKLGRRGAKVRTRVSKLSASTAKSGLLQTQERFCQLYTSSGEFFGNGTQSYIEAFRPKKVGNWYNSARAQACTLLTNHNIIKRVNELLETGGFNNENVDKQHLFLLNQHADLKTKLGAIREYNSLKSRIDRTEGGNKTLVVVVTGESAKRYGISPSTETSSP